MVGLPDETMDEVWETLNLNVQVKPAWAWVGSYQTLPGTELAHSAVDKGYLEGIDVAESDATFHDGSIILGNHPDGKKIMRLKNNANLLIKFPFLRGVFKHVIIYLPLDWCSQFINKTLYFVYYYSKMTYRLGFFGTFHSAFYMARRLKEFK
jgi:hypothetical protein